MKNYMIITILFLLFITPVFSQEKINCMVFKKVSCGENECVDMNIPQDDTRLIDITNRIIHVGSDQHQIKGADPSGVFLSFKFGGSAFLKMNMNEASGLPVGSFMEVRDLHLGSIISWGRCNFG